MGEFIQQTFTECLLCAINGSNTGDTAASRFNAGGQQTAAPGAYTAHDLRMDFTFLSG